MVPNLVNPRFRKGPFVPGVPFHLRPVAEDLTQYPPGTCAGCYRVHDGDEGQCRVASARVPESIDAFLRRAGVPRRYREMGETISSWQPVTGRPRLAALGYVAAWPPKQPFLVLAGAKGNGKTMLAQGILRAAKERHEVSGLFAIVPELIDRYRATQNPERAVETPDDIDALMRRVPLLVLDDLGVGRQTDFAEERLYRIVNRRYNEMQPTVFTTNVDLSSVEERIRDRMLSGEVVQFAGPSKRLAG